VFIQIEIKPCNVKGFIQLVSFLFPSAQPSYSNTSRSTSMDTPFNTAPTIPNASATATTNTYTTPQPPADTFERGTVTPANGVITSPLLKVTISPFSPTELQQLAQQPTQTLKWVQHLTPIPTLYNIAPVESLGQRMAMALRIHQALPDTLKPTFQQLLANGTLTHPQHTAEEQGHSGLYFLYALLTTPKKEGFNAKLLLTDALQIIANPDDIEQENTPLSAESTQALLTLSNHPTGNKHNQQQLPTPRTQQDVNIIRTFNCAMAAELSRMASQEPTQLLRQFVQLTSPEASYYQVVAPNTICPEYPKKAQKLLEKQNFTVQPLASGNFLVEVPAPETGIIRAFNTQQRMENGIPLGDKEASPLMILYQDTLLYNAVRKDYDVAADKRDTLDLAEVSIFSANSLSTEQKNLLLGILQQAGKPDIARSQVYQALNTMPSLSTTDKQAILNNLYGENQGITPDELQTIQRINTGTGEPYSIVNFQVFGPPANATHETENDQYLYGYVQSFEQIQQALITSLSAGKEVIISKTFALPNGFCLPGHEVKIKTFKLVPSPQANKPPELLFGLADTDDHTKGLQWESARELIPSLHHALLPEGIAKQQWQEILAHPQNLLVPDETDAQHFKLIPITNNPPPESLQLPGVQKQLELKRLENL
jgi:hypothetical protein